MSSALKTPAELDQGPSPKTDGIGTIPGHRRTLDKLARFSVITGGLAVIVAIFGILFFILFEVLPLSADPTVTPSTAMPWCAISRLSMLPCSRA